MEYLCFVMPIRPGKTAEALAVYRELEGKWRAEYERGLQRYGITKEFVWLARGVDGSDQLIFYSESPDWNEGFQQFLESAENVDQSFDRFYKDALFEVTGIDTGGGPEAVGEPTLLTAFDVDNPSTIKAPEVEPSDQN